MVACDPKTVFDTIKELDIVPEDQLDKAFSDSKAKHIPFEQLLVDRDLVSDQFIGKIIADIIDIPLVRLSAITIPRTILTIIPAVVAKKHTIIAFKKDTDGLHVAMAQPNNKTIAEFIERKTGEPVIIHYATGHDIDEALALYKDEASEVFSTLISSITDTSDISHQPIKNLVDTIIGYAQTNKASDIHITAREDVVVVRYRIDGILHEITTIPKSIQEQLITRIKVMANLRTDEHQRAQDGKIRWHPEDEPAQKLDIRVSIVPTTNGEKAVLRLLSEQAQGLTLEDLGLSPNNLSKIKQAITNPYGMMLVTGPTGSGKTTTLYAILKLLNKPEVNIMTIEDPVEYDIENIDQIQVNQATNLTFAEGLRSIVRQDPDVILVGEIRDSETSGIAVNAAMTGHLVLSTLHTNDAVTTFVRLIDMHVEPFLVASTISVIIAQRLLRQICSSCKVSKVLKRTDTLFGTIPKSLIEKYWKKDSTIRVFYGKGCDVCHHTGYQHRIGIFEVLIIDEAIKKHITDQSDSDTIKKQAIRNGMNTMLEDGLGKVQQGITTLEEVMRVTKE
jgi:type II secretory ATPase GspE/PulE/Tfp pilus assembly ATPase PilB-like protein